MGAGCSSVRATPVSVGGCPICDNSPSKDATWAEQFHMTEERIQDLAKCNEKAVGSRTFKELVAFLTAQTTSDVERFWVLFHWVQRESRRQHAQSRSPLSEDSPLGFLGTIKAGGRSTYADLYEKLCSTAGLKCETVTGLCQSNGDGAERPFAEQDNFPTKKWNVVTVGGKRALVDCEFELNFEANRMPPCYFMALPTHFAKTHFPKDGAYQLLQVRITLGEFLSHLCRFASRGKIAEEGSAVKIEAKPGETEDERETSGIPQDPTDLESMADDGELKMEDLKDSRLKPAPEGCTHHIMISYSWRQQKKVRKIKKHLIKAGYRVWFDEVDMEGTLASSMAKAVNDAAIVLIAFSKDYTESENCKREALLAQKEKKGIVPLKMTDYEPDGWLGWMLAGKLYIDFSSSKTKKAFRDKLKKMETEIEHSLAKRETSKPEVVATVSNSLCVENSSCCVPKK